MFSAPPDGEFTAGDSPGGVPIYAISFFRRRFFAGPGARYLRPPSGGGSLVVLRALGAGFDWSEIC